MPITASKYINNSDLGKSYVGLFHYNCPSRGKKEESLDIYGLLSVSSEVEIPGHRISKFAWDGIVDGFEYSKVDSTNESLKLALKEGVKRVKELIKNDTNIAEHGVNVDFTIFVSNGAGIYIGLVGDSDIYIYKEGRLVDVADMLKSQKAKTAAIAIEKDDLLFCSTKNVLKNNIVKLMAAKNHMELVSALEDVGRDIEKGEGLSIFLDKDEKIEEQKSLAEAVVTKSKGSKKEQLNIEPEDSDYVSTSKGVENKIFKTKEDEKDLRTFFSNIFEKISHFTENMKKKLKPIGKSLLKLLKKATPIPKRIYAKISDKFGKKRWFKKTAAKISQSRIGKKREGKFESFKIDAYKVKNLRAQRFKTLGLVTAGIVLVVLGVKFTMDQKQAREISKRANQIFVEVEGLLTQAQSKLSTDRDASEISAYKAYDKLGSLEDELNEKDSEKFEELETQVLGIQDTLFKIERLSKDSGNIQKFHDTFNTQVDSKPTDIGIYRDPHFNEYLLISDLGSKQIKKLSIYDKNVETIPDSGEVIANPAFVYMKDTGVFVYDLNNGILKAEVVDGEFKDFKKLSGLSTQNIDAQDPSEFAVLTVNENTYILDRGQNALLKSTNFGSGYGLSFSYLTNEEFSEANDILSDLSVYILTPGENGIHRYVNSPAEGKLVELPLAIKGLNKPLANARYGFTADDLNKSLYVFDSKQKRILRFEKPMESGDIRHPNELHLLKQYVISDSNEDMWNDVKDLVVDWDEKYLYLLDGTTIWRVTL